ncbi:MAG TPA: ABC transporter substrate-binding protein [Sphingobium sp.]
MLTRRSMLVLSGTSLALAACGKGGSTNKGGVLRVGSQRGGTKALLNASGTLDGIGYSVEWSEFPAAQPLLEAIGSGAVDLGLAGDAPFLFAYQAGSPIKAVQAQTAIGRPSRALGIVVPASSPVQSLTDLKGKRIATTRGSIGHYLILRALAAEKLPPDYVRITYLSPSDAKAALQSGAVDAWSVWVPYITLALSEGYRVLVDGKSLLAGAGFDVASDAAIAGKRELLKDFVAREAAALEWAKAHVDDYAKVLSRETGLPFGIAREMSIRNARVAVPFTPSLIAEQQTVVDTFRAAGEIKATRSIKDAFLTL